MWEVFRPVSQPSGKSGSTMKLRCITESNYIQATSKLVLNKQLMIEGERRERRGTVQMWSWCILAADYWHVKLYLAVLSHPPTSWFDCVVPRPGSGRRWGWTGSEGGSRLGRVWFWWVTHGFEERGGVSSMCWLQHWVLVVCLVSCNLDNGFGFLYFGFW